MINLDELMSKRIDVQLNNELLHIKEPTNALYQEYLEYQIYEGNEIFEKQVSLATKLLNRNDEGKKFKIEELKGLPQKVITRIVNEIFKITNESIRNPN